MRIEVSDNTFARLQTRATPLVDTVDDVITRLLDADERKGSTMANPVPSTPDVMMLQARVNTHDLRGFLRELWELVISRMPFDRFTLRDVYERKEPLVALRPHVKEIEASIRAGLEKLRDRSMIEFVDNRGTYRRLV
jgi:hypothetical protein